MEEGRSERDSSGRRGDERRGNERGAEMGTGRAKNGIAPVSSHACTHVCAHMEAKGGEGGKGGIFTREQRSSCRGGKLRGERGRSEWREFPCAAEYHAQAKSGS